MTPEEIEAEKAIMYDINFHEDKVISELALSGELNFVFHEYAYEGKVEGISLVAFLNCNDLFGPGADAEPISSYVELKKLYEYYKSGYWGTYQFLIEKRKRKPWKPDIIEIMKKANAWKPEYDSFTSFQWKIEETKEKKNKPEFLEYILLTIIALFLIALTSVTSIAIFNMITDNRPPDKPIKYIQYQSKAK